MASRDYGGAAHLASIYGSEQDKVNCSFYLKIGACRHGDRCSRKHIKPQFSQTLVVSNMYTNPTHAGGPTMPGMDPARPPAELSEPELKEYFDQFCKQALPFPPCSSQGYPS